ncbi:MAG: adaptor protein MecA [Bilifractor sp.]|jgi:adapter protein MecA 1/2
MKIEKINDSQIRCTLTSEDLESRKIRLSELAYGSEKAKALFQDMMQEAQAHYGFNSGNSPLMIEAIPVSQDSIMLIITKVDDPEELDYRFAKFSPSKSDSAPEEGSRKFTGADDVLDLFQKIRDARDQASGKDPKTDSDAEKTENDEVSGKSTGNLDLMRAFRFSSLDLVIRAAHSLNGFYSGKNTLLKGDGFYDLVLQQSGSTPEQFNKVCNILTEFGSSNPISAAEEAHMLEHGDIIIRRKALQTLAKL